MLIGAERREESEQLAREDDGILQRTLMLFTEGLTAFLNHRSRGRNVDDSFG